MALGDLGDNLAVIGVDLVKYLLTLQCAARGRYCNVRQCWGG